MSTLRHELLIRRLEGGRYQVLDPLTDRIRIMSEEALAADPSLHEGPVAEQLRAAAWAAYQRLDPPLFPRTEADWSRARELPPLVTPAWREPESWRRLAEARAAGEHLLLLPGFTTWRPPCGAEERLDTELVHVWRTRMRAPLFEHPALRHLVSGVLGVRLDGPVECNRFRMAPGDGILTHRDGRHYLATFTLGLCEGWTAADGGAIAFGDPATGEVSRRWLPHAGDLMLFGGGEWRWHWVEAPRRERHTLTGWWTRRPRPAGGAS